MLVKLDHFPKFGIEKYVKPPPSLYWGSNPQDSPWEDYANHHPRLKNPINIFVCLCVTSPREDFYLFPHKKTHPFNNQQPPLHLNITKNINCKFQKHPSTTNSHPPFNTKKPRQLLGGPRKLGSKVRISGLFHPNISHVQV